MSGPPTTQHPDAVAATGRGERRNRALAKAGVAAVVARSGTSITALLLMPVLARLLGVESYGVLLTLTTMSSLLLLGNLGIGAGLVSRLSLADDPAAARAVLSSAYAIVMLASLAGAVVVSVLAVVLPWESWTPAAGVSDTRIHVCALIAMLGAVLQVTTGLGQQVELSRQRGHTAAWWLGAANVSAAVVATVLAVLTRDLLWTLVGMSLTPPAVMAAQSVGVLRTLPAEARPRRSAVSRTTMRELLVSGGHFTGLAVLGAMAFQLDILIVSAFLGSDAAAQYGVTTRLFALVSTTIQVAVTQLWSAVADARRHGDAEWVRNILLRLTAWCSIGGLAASALLLVLGQTLVQLWVGPAFVPTTALLAAAALWTVLGSATAPLVFYLNGIRKEREQFLVAIPMTVVNLGLSLWWVQLFGISGVLWASCVAWAGVVVVPLVLIARRSLAEDALVASTTVRAEAPTDTSSDALVQNRSSTPPGAEVDASEDAGQQATTPGDDSSQRSRAGGYRPDVDGLRAVAVLAVIGFHFFPGSFPGGFVGVDVFFVVSGFLITGLLARRLDLGTFTIGDFYARRVRRIFPALGLVVAATLAVGWLVLFTDEFRSLASEATAGSFFVANFHFMQEASYFDTSAYTKPLLHLWSLAIEEQFYLVWPVIMLWALRRGRRATVTIVVLLTVASFAVNLYLAATDPSTAYYSPLSRFWQLSAGGLLALVPWGDGLRRRWVATSAAAAGMLLIALAVLTFSSAVAYPGVWGVAPVLGTLLVIAAGSRSWINRRLLSWRVAVGIGLISYPLYLWHWPMISFATIVGRQFPPALVRIGLVLVAFALAIATYRLIERPLRLRHTPARTWRPLAAGIVALGLVSALAAAPFGPSSANPTSSVDRSALSTWPYETNPLCDDRYPFDEKVGGWWFCVTNEDRDPDILLLGDSTANELYPGIVDSFPDSTVLSIGTCAPTRGITYRPNVPTPGNPCFQPRSVDQEKFIDRTISDVEAPWVVLHAIWPRFDAAGRWVDDAGNPAGTIRSRSDADPDASDRDAFVAGLEARVATIEAAGGRVLLVGPKPQIGYDVALCFPRPFSEEVQSCEVPAADQRASYASFAGLAAEVQRDHPTVTVFDQSPVYCSQEVCSLVSDGRPLMRDQVHLSEIGSEAFGAALADWASVELPDFGRPSGSAPSDTP